MDSCLFATMSPDIVQRCRSAGETSPAWDSIDQAGLSIIALVGLTRGRRGGGLVDVFQWTVIWLPFAFGLRQFSPDAYGIATAISLAGALAGALAFVTARRGRIPTAGPA